MRREMLLIAFLVVLALALGACGGDSSEPEEPAGPTGDATAGGPLFQGTCSACHGPDGKGLPNLGKDLTTSEFVRDSTQQELVEFIKAGRPASDPLNTTGVDMPPKGGNPSLTDEQLLDIAAYVFSIEE